MQYQRLNGEQRQIRDWRLRRNHIVCELLAKNPDMRRSTALKQANRQMNQGRKRKKK